MDDIGHVVVGYAYTELWNDYSNEIYTFIKILDGQNTGNRFIDASFVAEQGTSSFAVVDFAG